jgi:predicted secreted protein
MDIISGFTVYVVMWWGVLYMVLPWRSAPPLKPIKGHASSAPAMPRLRQKFLLTTLISAILWVIVYKIINLDLYSFSGRS